MINIKSLKIIFQNYCRLFLEKLKYYKFFLLEKLNHYYLFLLEKSKRKKISKYNKKLISSMNKVHHGSNFYSNDPGFIIQLKNVSKWYYKAKNPFSSLKNINLHIKKGEYVVILGPSGSGKTSLLNIISGLERASNGQVVVNHHNLITMTEKQLTIFRKKFIGFVFQSYLLLSNLKIIENIELGFELSNYFCKKINIKQIIKELELDIHLNKYPHQLSGGQQQRVSIARALAKQPIILFADEPTGAVDEKTSNKILQLFSDINKKHKTTIVIVTHNPDIAKLATKVIYIKNGQIDKFWNQTPVSIQQFIEKS